MAVSAAPPVGDVQNATTSDCWGLLESATIGRLELLDSRGVRDVYPVSYLVHDGCVLIRTAPRPILTAIAKNPEIAFEIDGEDDATSWSVLIKGVASRVDADTEIEASGVRRLVSAHPTRKEDSVRIVALSIDGQRRGKLPETVRVRRPVRPIATPPVGPERTTSSEIEQEVAPRRPAGATKPIPIPHFPPITTPRNTVSDGAEHPAMASHADAPIPAPAHPLPAVRTE